ncbi:MAG: hydrogenase formation protein HypD [bacterium]|nr:hydrogenase formation protein HypD [bacterium]
MKYIDEFRKRSAADGLIAKIKKIASKKVSLMEVCGTHTMAIFKYGIKNMLPERVNLISGPGCPVCVTPQIDIVRAIAISKLPNVMLASFGDMMRVPGGNTSLENEKAKGRDIRIVYSPLDSLDIAKKNKDKRVVFLGVGFETTSPSIAATILKAYDENINNLFFLSCHKLIPPTMKALLSLGEVRVDGFICPGHVSTLIGTIPYEFIAKDYNIPCVIAGFEPLDILQSILMLLEQINEGKALVKNQYTRCVKPEGNIKAMEILREVFEVSDSSWRGIGVIPKSGLKIREKYKNFDASAFEIEVEDIKEEEKGCICGNILRGINKPYDCKLFGKECTPLYPVGPCMVSTEGTCAAYYKYERRR